MNATDRKTLRSAANLIRDAINTITEIRERAQGRFDELSENAQNGPTGEALQDDINALEDAEANAENAADQLEQI